MTVQGASLGKNWDGSEEFFFYDEVQDKVTIKRQSSDMSPILDRNKEMLSDPDCAWSPTRDMVHAASIPLDVVLVWKEKHGVDLFNKSHMPAVKRLLNSSDYLYLRTWNGRL